MNRFVTAEVPWLLASAGGTRLDLGSVCIQNRAMNTASPKPAPRGRPREFHVEDALDNAISVFSSGGFHGTSLSELAEGMRLTQGSIYKAFKDKRHLFLAALDRQEMLYASRLQRELTNARTGRDKIRAALAFYATLSHGQEGMQGCLVVTTAVELAASDRLIAKRVRKSFGLRQANLRDLIREGRKDGSIPEHVDPEGTAWMLLFLFQGLRVVGKAGVAPGELAKSIDAAMKTLN